MASAGVMPMMRRVDSSVEVGGVETQGRPIRLY